MSEEERAPERSTLSSPHDFPDHSDDDLNDALSSLEDAHPTSQTIEEHLSTLEALSQGDFDDQKAIQALPLRRKKIQRPLTIQLAKLLYPEMTEIVAVIQYERLTILAKSIVRDRQKARLASQMNPKTPAAALKVQEPWKGQEVDPMDLKGPAAIPMPVEIGKSENFAPIFSFLARDESFAEANRNESEFLKKNEQFTGNVPLLEFTRGLVYEDGRLDLCKKVVGPTHIGKLMDSLESNNHIRHFLLGNNAVSTTGAKRIAEFISKHPDRMETWYLAGCHITRHGLSILVPQMITSSTITNLWFKRNPFGPNSSGLLAELVLRTENLRTLDLETTELGDEGTRRFIDSITGHPSALRNLYLNANGIGQSACASLGKYLADPRCALESLFLSTNPIGDAGMLLLAPGVAKNMSIKRLTCASAGLTGKGLSYLASALVDGDHALHTLDIGASQTTKAHSQKFNYFDDSSVEALKSIIMLPSLRWLNVGRAIVMEVEFQEIRSAVSRSELVFFDMHRIHVANLDDINSGKTDVYDGTPASKSCSLEVRKQLAKNQAKYYQQHKDYDEFLNSEDFRFLRNTSDVRKIDSMYRTRDKRLGLPMDAAWEGSDPVWELIVEDAQMAEAMEK